MVRDRNANEPAERPKDPGREQEHAAWIETVGDAEAEGELRDFYRRFGGHVDHILLAESLNPLVLRAHYDLYRAVMFGPSPLTRAQREMIAVVVSRLNQCDY